ncbi:MAG: hypothetical protein SOI41_02700 [Heyndrickxia coagulans]|uniref:Uncharacterized protein n=1 Tax=Heyndrickxia coagulans TaxID=1398 RepID=A0A150JXR0_HEYCO|nr:hypothetical protein [Heyndrickxia coagulans]KYC62070.1 hypothetical protein B4098_3433 [Heyndrickxia coagulans]
MILKEDYQDQLNILVKNIEGNMVFSYKRSELERCFSFLYLINFLSKRVELKRFFDSKACLVSYSCLIEAFMLLIENHPRGSSLVIRSAIENFIKNIIKITGGGEYYINDRSYGENIKTLNSIIENHVPEKYKPLFNKTTAQISRLYYLLSGLSHSLTPESEKILLNYFSDTRSINTENIDTVTDNYLSALEHIFTLSLLICRNSLEIWERENLEEIFRIVYGKKRTQTLLQLFSNK